MKFQNSSIQGFKVMLCIKKRDERTEGRTNNPEAIFFEVGGIKSAKGTGAQNIGQGHQVKIPAESVHLGEALCKVWWLEVLHLRRSGMLT